MTNEGIVSQPVDSRARIVGIDASRAIRQDPTGTEYYSRALIDAILRADSDLRFRLYTPFAPPGDLFPRTNNYQTRVIPFPRLWTHLRLSYELWVDAPDALFVPAHVLPLIHPRNSLVTVHDLGYKIFPEAHSLLSRLYLDWSTRWNARAARVVIADSCATKQDVIRFYGTQAERIHVVYPSYNAKVYRPVEDERELVRVRAKYGLSEKYVLSVGTVQPRKNYGRLVEASAALPPEYSLVIVGKKGFQFPALEARVGELGMARRVRFLNYVPLEDMPSLYGGARAAVVPSLYEGFGFPALEAQACGTPLVSSNSSSLPEVAGAGALYFDPKNVEEMARALALGVSDEEVRGGLVASGFDNVKRFSWDRAARQIVEIVRAF
jgi:glycosyltransferase involved in cell wall biosynthesis